MRFSARVLNVSQGNSCENREFLGKTQEICVEIAVFNEALVGKSVENVSFALKTVKNHRVALKTRVISLSLSQVPEKTGENMNISNISLENGAFVFEGLGTLNISLSFSREELEKVQEKSVFQDVLLLILDFGGREKAEITLKNGIFS